MWPRVAAKSTVIINQLSMSVRAGLLLALAASSTEAFLRLQPKRFLASPSLRSTAGDTVTGTKFEEEDETKNPQRRPGEPLQPSRSATRAPKLAFLHPMHMMSLLGIRGYISNVGR